MRITSFVVTVAVVSICFLSCQSKKDESIEVAGTSLLRDSTQLADSVENDILMGSTKADEYYENTEAITWERNFIGSFRKPNGKTILFCMALKAENGMLTGSYFYPATKLREDIRLEGFLEHKVFELREYDKDDKLTGHFLGVDTDETFEGEWKSPDGNTSLIFKILGDDKTYEERKAIGATDKDIEID